MVSVPNTVDFPDSTPTGPQSRKECVLPVISWINDTVKLLAI